MADSDHTIRRICDNVCWAVNWWLARAMCIHVNLDLIKVPLSSLTSRSITNANVDVKPATKAVWTVVSYTHWLKFPAPCGPWGPTGPWGPCNPVLPGFHVSPWGPKSPFAPSTPSVPFFPGSPLSPLVPASPCAPLGPIGPCGPSGPWSPFEPLKPGGPVAPCNLLILWIYKRRIKGNELRTFSIVLENN